MDIQITERPKSEMLLKITLDKKEQADYYELVRKALSDKTDIAGFRKGKAPLKDLTGKLGQEKITQAFFELALPYSYTKAIEDNKLHPVSRPQIKVLSPDPLSYEAIVAIFPEVKVPGYKDVKIPKKEVKLDGKEVELIIDQMRKSRAKHAAVNRAAQKGDMVEIDFQGYDKGGAALDKTESKNHPVIIGEGSLVPGFEDNLIGMKRGEKKRFTLKFPKDFTYKPFQNKDIEFEVTMNMVSEVELPELNAEFIEGLLGVAVDEATFRKRIEDDVRKQKEQEALMARENDLLEKWLKKTKADVAPCLVDEEIDFMLKEATMNFSQRGMNFEEYKEKTEKEKGKTMREIYKDDAEKRVKIRIMLQYIFKEEGVEVTEEELKDIKPEERPATINKLRLDKLFTKFL